MIPSYETLVVSLDEHVATVCLNRPDKANAMNGPMWSELQACFEWLDEEPSVRVVILAGNGKVLFMGTDSAWRWRRGSAMRRTQRGAARRFVAPCCACRAISTL